MGRLGKVVPTAVTVHLWFTLCRTRVRQTDLVSNDVRHRTFPSHLRVAFFGAPGLTALVAQESPESQC